VRRALTIALLATLSCCHSPKASQQNDVHPQRDEVRFFERPRTLAAAKKSAVPMPALVLIESDPWLDVVGSDSPSLALYEDGTVIQLKGNGFVATQLTRDSRDKLLQSVSAEALRPFYGEFAATTSTDQITEELLVYHGVKPVFISVYGSLEDPEVRSKIPSQVVAAFDTLKAFNPPAEHPWLPHQIEVMVWPYEYTPDVSTEWPRDLPDLNDPDTVSRGDSFSIFVPASKLDEVRATLARRKEKGAILINGKKWAASIRFPFPQEQLWMAPNNEVQPSAE
jgi:hypothetical protein